MVDDRNVPWAIVSAPPPSSRYPIRVVQRQGLVMQNSPLMG